MKKVVLPEIQDMIKRYFILRTIGGTLFIFLAIFGFGKFLDFFEVLDPIGEALEDVELTDISFSQLKSDPEINEDVVLVNIGHLSREGIARLVDIINQHEPAVIGVDSYFYFPREERSDSILAASLDKVKNLVMVSKVIEYNEERDEFDSLARSYTDFIRNAHTAFANFDTDAEHQDEYKIVRSIPVFMDIKEHREYAFGAKMANLYAPEKFEKLMKRGKQFEEINFTGNAINPHNWLDVTEEFRAIDVEDLLSENFDPDWVRGKAVFFGYMGETFQDNDWDDKFYTPMNKVFAGKAEPDMFGVAVHANFFSMILKEDYINSLSTTSYLIISILLTYINVFFFTIIFYKLDVWYDGLTKVISLIEIAFLFMIIFWAFATFNLKLNFTLGIIAILISSDALEVFYGIILNLFTKEGRAIVRRGKRAMK